MKRTLFFMVLMLFSIGMLFAQIPVFSEDWEAGTEGWTISNNTGGAVNGWYRGTVVSPAAPGGGTYSMYVSGDGGETNTSLGSPGQRSYVYRDVEVPAGGMDLTLKFDIKIEAESYYDYVRVYYMPTTVTPVGSTLYYLGTSEDDPYLPYRVGELYYQANSSTPPQLPNGTEWHTQTVSIPSSFIGQTGRLVFCWNNDGSVANQPPGAIDNISVVYYNADSPPLPAVLVFPPNGGTFISPGVTLQWAGAPTGAAASSYSVKLGTANPPTQEVYSGTQTSYTPSAPLAGETQYYWQVVPSNAFGNATNCPVWSFTTTPEGLIVVDLMPDGTTSTYTYPVNYFYRNSVSQTIYTEAEMGGVASYGQITGLEYRFYHAGDIADLPVQIYLANAPSSFNSFASTTSWYAYANFVKVWDGPLPHDAIGLQDFIVSVGAGHGAGTQDFIYEGENLVMMMYKTTNGGDYGSSSNVWHYNAGTAGINRTLYRYTDTTPPEITPESPGSGTTAVNFAKIKIYIDALDPPENELQVTNLSGPGIYNPAIPYVLTVRNGGSNNAPAGDYTIQFYRVATGGNTALGSPITTTPAIASGATVAITVETSSWGFEVEEQTTYQINAVLTWAPDENTANNTSNTLSVIVYPSSIAVIDLMPSTGGQSSYAYPVNYYYHNSISQTIYTEAELGGLANYGQITSLRYRFFNSALPVGLPIQVYLANAPSDIESFSSTTDWYPYAEFVKVWDGPLPHTEAGLQDFSIDVGTGHGPGTQDFIYEGEAIIMMMYRADTNYYSSANVWHLNDGVTDVTRTLYRYTDTDPPPFTPEDPSAGSPTTYAVAPYAKIQMFIERMTLGTLSGTITDFDTDDPIENAKVYLTSIPRNFVTTNADGEYSMINVPTNRSLTYYAVGYQTQIIEPEDIGWDEETATAVKDVALLPRTDGGYIISGVVATTDYNVGIDGIEVSMVGYISGTTVTDTDEEEEVSGYYAFPNLYASESYTISVYHKGFAPFTTTITIPNQDDHTITLNILLPERFKPPFLVTAEEDETDNTKALLSWGNPLWGYAAFSYARPGYDEIYGNGSGNLNMIPAHRYSHEKLVEYDAIGTELMKVSFIPGSDAHTYVVKVWVTENNNLTHPGTLTPVAEVPVPAESIVIQEINEVMLPTPIPIPDNGQIFVGIHMTGPLGFAAPADETSFVAGYSDLYYWDNGTSQSWHFGGSEGLELAWCIYLEAMEPDPADPAPVVYSTVIDANAPISVRRPVDSVISASGLGQGTDFADFWLGRTYNSVTRAFNSEFEIYRMLHNDTAGSHNRLATYTVASADRFIEYTDTTWGAAGSNLYKYAVRARYEGSEYWNGATLSEPAYSNSLSHLLVGTAAVNVYFGTSAVTGAVITLSGANVETLTHTLVAGDNGVHTFTIYRNQPYHVGVTLNGTSGYSADYIFNTPATVLHINLIAAGTALFSETFDGPMPTGWTNIDADSDGRAWMFNEIGTPGPGGLGIDTAAFSQSWDGIAYTPDNWLISPPIEIPANGVANFDFLVAAQDQLYPYDRILVYIAPAGAGTPGWQTFLENRDPVGGNSGSPNNEVLAAGVALLIDHVVQPEPTNGGFYTLGADISAYAGQSVRIAYRHAFCYDWFYVKIANMRVTFTPYGTMVNVTGSVVDGVTTQPIAGATVALSSVAPITAVTDATGAFTLTGVPGGTSVMYTLTVSKVGYQVNNNTVFNVEDVNYAITTPIQLTPRTDIDMTLAGYVYLNDSRVGENGITVTLSGYSTGTQVTANSSGGDPGYFAFTGLYGNETYALSVGYAGYAPFTQVVPLSDNSIDNFEIVLTELINSPFMVTAGIDAADETKVIVRWINPLWGFANFSYADPISVDALGNNGFPIDMIIVHRYDHAKLEALDVIGYELFKLSFIAATNTHSYTAQVWVTNDNNLEYPDTLEPVATGIATGVIIGAMNDINLSSIVTIPTNGQIFIGIKIAGDPGYPGSYANNTYVAGYSDVMCWNGEWQLTGPQGFPLAWCVYASALEPDVANPSRVVFSAASEPQPTIIAVTEKEEVTSRGFSASALSSSVSISDFYLGHIYSNVNRAFDGDYEIYRMVPTATAAMDNLLASPTIPTTGRDILYEDTTWGALTGYSYKYAVKQKYTGVGYPGGAVTSPAVYSNTIVNAKDLIFTNLTGSALLPMPTASFTATIKNAGGYPVAANSYSLQFYMQPAEGDAVAIGAPVTTTPAMAADSSVQIVVSNLSSWTWTLTEMQVFDIYAKLTYAPDEYNDNDTSNVLKVSVFPMDAAIVDLMPATGGSLTVEFPVNYYYNNSISQTIYTAAELGGATNFGELTHLFLKMTDAANVPTSVPVQVFIANIPETDGSFSGTNWYDSSLFTQVYNAPFPVGTGTGTGVKTFMLELGTGADYQPFVYFGGNLVVMMYKTWTSWYSGNTFHVNNGEAGVNRTLLNYTDTNPPPFSPDNVSGGAATPMYAKALFVFNRLPVGTASGTVSITGTTTPVANAAVSVTGIPSVTTTSNAQGAYTLPGVPLTFGLSATAFGYEMTNIANSSITWTTTEPYTATVPIALVPRPQVTVSGRVILSDSGEGEDGLTIYLTGYEDKETVTSTIGGLPGSFSFANVYGNTSYTISVELAGFSSYTSTFQVAAADVVIPAITLTERFYMPTRVVAETLGANARVSWINPLRGYSNFSHARPQQDDSIGTGGGTDFVIAHRYSAAQLAAFEAAGMNLYKVGFMPNYVAATYSVVIWTTTNNNLAYPDGLVPVAEVPYPGQTSVGELHEITLPNPVEIPSEGQLFVGVHIITPGGYPAGIDQETETFEGFGNLMYFGGAWQNLTDLNPALNGNWCIYNSASVSGTANPAPATTIFTTLESRETRHSTDPLSAMGQGYSIAVEGWRAGHAPDAMFRSFNGSFVITRMLSTQTIGTEVDIVVPDPTALNMEYIDTEWGGLPENSYKYTVQAKYLGSAYDGDYVLSAPAHSNVLLKGNTVSLTVNVAMQGNSVAGAVIALTNPNPEVPDLSYTLTAADNGSHLFPAVYKNVIYELTVRITGGTTYNNTHTFTDDANTLNVNLLAVLPVFTQTFNVSSIPTGWVNVDADNDGHMWIFGTQPGPTGNQYSAMSQSYDNNLGEFTPDNWLISPPIELPANASYEFSFMIAAQDQSYANERVLVYVGPDGDNPIGWNTFLVNRHSSNPNNEVLQDGVEMLDDHTVQPFASNNGFYPLNYNISQFAGQIVRVAYRHAFCTDWYEVKIANMEITSGSFIPINVSGTVVNEQNVALANALVSISSAMPVSAMTNASGAFTLTGVPGNATYTISVSRAGYHTNNETQITVEESNFVLPSPIVMRPTSEADVTKPFVTALRANYPNPFNPSTTIAFDTHKDGRVVIDIFNIKGQKVKALVNDVRQAGSHKIVWNGQDDFGRDVSSGIYFYRMQTEGYAATRKMLLMK